MSNKVIIACTINHPDDCGKNHSPQLIADSVYAAWKAGASICRLCINDDREEIMEAIRLIRDHKECDVMIACDFWGEASFTGDTGAAFFNTMEGIEIGTCTIGTFNREGDSPVYNIPGYLKELMTTFHAKRIRPECRVLDMGMLGNAKWLLKSGYLCAPLFCRIRMGMIGGIDDTVESLLHIVHSLPDETIWSASAGKGKEMPVIYSCIVLGGNISIDLIADGMCTDVSLVERAGVAIREYGKVLATAAEAREMLQLPAT